MNNRVLVNIRGTNGSGKSTIPLSMMDDPEMRVVGFRKKNGKLVAPYVTVFPTYGWVALGTYFNKTGGMDTIATTDLMKMALEFAWNKYPQYDIVMEGIICSTIRSTYINLFNNYQKRIAKDDVVRRKIIVVNFLPPVEVCIERVQERNGGKPVKEAQIESKWRSVAKNHQEFLDAGILSVRVDTSKVSKEAMLWKFNDVVDKQRGKK